MDLLDLKALKLTQLCRLCLAEDGLMVHLFAEERYGHKVPLSERILCCTTVEVKEGDDLPAFVCHRCIYYVDSFLEFRLRCQRVNAALHIFCNEIKYKTDCEESAVDKSQPSSPTEISSHDDSVKQSALCHTPVSQDGDLKQGLTSKPEKTVNGTSSACESDSDSVLDCDMSSKDSRMGPSNKPYHCPHCNKPFTYKARLAAHIKTHGESQVYQGDSILQVQQQTMQQPSMQSLPQQAPQHNLQHSMVQQPLQPQAIQAQSMQAHAMQQQHLQHQLSPGSNPYISQQHSMQYSISQQPLSHHIQQQAPVQQQYLPQSSASHGSPRASSQPISPLHAMSPQHHPMQQLHHLQQQTSMQQQAAMHQTAMQQQASMQHQVPSMQQVSLQQQLNIQSQPSMQQQASLPQQSSIQQVALQEQASMQQHGSGHQASMQHPQGILAQTMHQQSLQQQSMQQSLQQSMQQQMLQQQSMQQQGQSYDGRMYDMNYMPETPGTPPSSGSDSSYSCSSCSATFMTPWMLADHVRSRCCDPNVSYNCDKCYSQFGSFNDLEQHKVTRSCENQVPSYYDAYTPPPSHYGMYTHQHQQDYSSGGEMMDSRNTPSPWNVISTRSPGSVGNGGSSRSRMQRQDSYSTRSPQLGTMEELEKFAMSNTVVTSPLEPLASPGLTEPLPSVPSPLDPENSVQSVQSVQSTHSTQSSGSGSCGPRSSINFNSSSNVRFGGPNFCGGNVSSNYGGSNANPSFMGNAGQSFSGSGTFGNSSPNQNYVNNNMMQNPTFGRNGNCSVEQNSSSSSVGNLNTQNLNYVDESNLSFGNSILSNYSKKSGSDCSSPQDSRLAEVNANTKFCDDLNSCQQDQKDNLSADSMGSPNFGSPGNECKSSVKVNESLTINVNDSVNSSCAEMLLSTSPGSSKGYLGGGGDNPYSCQVCKASFASRTLFTNHMKTHAPDRPVKCNLCNNSFPSTAALRSHVDSAHSESGSEKSLHIVLDDSQSPGKINENGNSDDSDDEPLSKLVKPTPPPPKRRGRKPKAQVESENGEKPHECSYCGKGFVTSVRLAIHTKLHTAEKPFKCDQCDKAFRSRAHLQRHVKTHAGDKPFKCLTCNKSFTVSMNLKIHMRTHTGERPYQCNLCKMAFIGYSHLYNHLKTHSDTQGPFTYTYFNKVYTTTGNFTLTKREKTARGRNKDRDLENDPSKEGENDQLKEAGRGLGKSTTGKKRGRKAHFYEPEPEDDDEDVIAGDEEDEGNESSDET